MTKGQRIRARREELNMGLTELAEKTHILKQTLYKYENEIVTNIPSDKIEVLAKALDTTPAYLMGWEEAFCDLFFPNENTEDDFEIVDLSEPKQKRINKAIELYNLYENADADIKSVVDTLLKRSQQES